MLRTVGCALALVVATSAGAASDKVEQGPAPAWVKPVALPAAPKEDEQPIRVLLVDEQVRLEHGRQTRYGETALRIQTPQGLSAGNIGFAWRAETDRPIVHRLVILRGDQVIDVLKNGQTFTVVRREPNLEQAMLDNVLTANIQPEGLQVGDIVDLAMTIVSEDPTLKDHAQQAVANWNVPIVKAHARVEWPNEVAVQVRANGALPAAKPVRKGDITAIEWTMTDVKPPVRPKLAPGRFQIGRVAELSDFAGWSGVVALMTPLYDKAATVKPDGPLAAEIARIRAASTDPVARAEAALALVEDRVRYVALLAGTGGLVPAESDVTWGRRFGDCKGKTALLLALLRPLGIAAEPVLVNTVAGDGLADRLPSATLFDHVLVRATIAGKAYWLDGTRTGDTRLDRLRVPYFRWGLPLAPGTTALTPIVPPPLDRPSEVATVRIDARDGITLPASMHAELVFRDDAALGTKIALAALVGDQRDRALRDFWKGRFDFFEPRTVSAGFDPATGEEKLIADGVATLDWKRGYLEIEGVGVGYTADLKRDPGPQADAPYAVPYPFYTTVSQTILLPPGFPDKTARSPQDVDETVAGIVYRRNSTLKGGVYTIEKSERSVAMEFPFAEAAAAEPKLRDLANNTIGLQPPRNYRGTPKENAALIASKPTTVDQSVRRAAALMEGGRRDEASAEIERALVLEPKNPAAMRLRAMIHLSGGDLRAAAGEIEAAAAANPNDPMLLRMRASLAIERKDHAAAIAMLGTALEASPQDGDLLSIRALAYSRMGDPVRALADCDAAIAAHTGNPETYLLKANLLRKAGRLREIAAVAAAASGDLPGNQYAHVVAANIYWTARDKAAAFREYDAALAIKPDGYVYLNRALRRPPEQAEAALADYDAALRLDPKQIEAYAGKAALLSRRGDHAGALKMIDTGLAIEPGSTALLAGRLLAHARQHADGLVDRDVVALTGTAKDGFVLNDVCYTLAQEKLALPQALSLCEAALAKLPDAPAILDSRGFVKLRLGRYGDAIADFDRALAKAPDMAASLYGRAVAEARTGDAARSKADVEAALKGDPGIKDEFARYGVMP